MGRPTRDAPPSSFVSPGNLGTATNNNRLPVAPSSAPVNFRSGGGGGMHNGATNGRDNQSHVSGSDSLYSSNDRRKSAPTMERDNQSHVSGTDSTSRRAATSNHHFQQQPQQQQEKRMLPPRGDLTNNRAASTPTKSPKKSISMDSPGQTESETAPEDDSGIDYTDSDSRIGVTSAFDDKGRCVKHPHIKLRKKKMLGGWKVMLVNCPDCCIEEMLKMRKSQGGAGGENGKHTKNGLSKTNQKNNPPFQRKESHGDTSSQSSALPPISQLTISHRKSSNGGGDDERSTSSGSASTITYGTKTDFSRHSAGAMSWQNYSGDNSGSTPGSGPHRVTRMPFTDAYGERGWYTGDVASGSGLPHGKGAMHYCDGRMRQGRWCNGLAGEMSSPSPSLGGGGGNKSTISRQKQQHQQQHGSGNSVNSDHHRGGGGNSHSRHHQGGGSVRKSKVVCGMEWTDLEGANGFFTGETDEDNEPHGMGSMRYHRGEVLEGKWYHGEFEGRNMNGGVGSSGRSVGSSSKSKV